MVKRTDHKAVAAKLRANPGKWYKVAEYGTVKSAQEAVRGINKGEGSLARPGRAYAPVGKGDFQAKLRGGDTSVWARFVA